VHDEFPLVPLISVAVPVVTPTGSQQPQQQPGGLPPWTLAESQIREIVGRVRAGRDLTPKR
jgi:hypothetical protein